jgi:hypothetical protein
MPASRQEIMVRLALLPPYRGGDICGSPNKVSVKKRERGSTETADFKLYGYWIAVSVRQRGDSWRLTNLAKKLRIQAN